MIENPEPLTRAEQAVECAWHLLIIVGMSPFVLSLAFFLRFDAPIWSALQ